MATNVKATKKYKTLVALLGNEEAALVAYNAAEGVVAPPALSPVDQLVAAGFTPEQAKRALAQQQAAAAPAPLTSKEQGDVLVAQRGFVHTKGRVYVTPTIVEAVVRVLKTGKPEVVESSGVGRTKAVVIFREESGDVACQNLTNPA